MAQTVSYSQFEAMVYQSLMQPETDTPNRVQVWHAINAQAQLMFAAIQNTDIPAGTGTYSFSTVAQQRDYLISATDFSKDVCISTKDSANPYHQAQEVLRIKPQDANLHYNGPAIAGGSGHTAVCMAMYRDATGDPYVRVYPTPSDSAEYEILYETDDGMFGAVGDSFRFPSFIHLLRYRVSLELLPYCEWSKLDDAATEKRMQRLALSLSTQEQKYTKEWEAFLDNDSQPGSFHRIGYAEGYI